MEMIEFNLFLSKSAFFVIFSAYLLFYGNLSKKYALICLASFFYVYFWTFNHLNLFM